MPVLTNIRHELFAQAVAKGEDHIVAYKQAGFKPNEGSAWRLHTNAQVASRIAELLKDAALNTGVTIERVTQEIANIAFLDLREAADWGVRDVPLKKPIGRMKTVKEGYVDLKPARDLPERVARAIHVVRKTKEGVELRPYNKLDALVRLGQQLGMFEPKDTKDTGTDALVAMIIKAHQRAKGDEAKVIEGEAT